MYKRVYLLGIGGIAMANLACLLKKRGFIVSGSDLDTFGPSAVLLKDNDIKYFKNHDEGNIKKFKPDVVVIGNAMSRGNPSLEYVLNNKIPYRSMPEIIREVLIEGKESVVIAGTSGKTTTASLITWILHKSGLKPTALVGGIIKDIGSGFINGTGKNVVIEGDEYNSSFYDSNPKFLYYRPYHALITNIQMDHLDLYGNIDNIFQAFKKLIKLIPSSGSLVLNRDNQYTSPLEKELKSKVTTFGQGADLEAKNIKYTPDGTSFELFKQGKKIGEIKSRLLGNHNVENLLAAIAVALNLNVPFSKISSAIATFLGVKRRLDIIHQKDNVTIIDDFAHNPEKVQASLSALKNHFPKHNIVAIFEPRTGSSRRKFFQNIYPRSFSSADTIYIAEPFKKTALNSGEAFSENKLAEDLKKKGLRAYALKNADEIIGHLTANLPRPVKKPTVIIVMTSGEFDGIHQKLKAWAVLHN